MEINFINYKELNNKNKGISLKENIHDEPYQNQEVIYDYLLDGGKVEAARLSRYKDIFNNKIIPQEGLIRYDGTYYWSNVLAYYVRNYNLRLPKDVENHILQKYHDMWEPQMHNLYKLKSLDELMEEVKIGMDIEFFVYGIRYNISWENCKPFICVCPYGDAVFYDTPELMFENHKINGKPLKDIWQDFEMYSF
ncbi:MAG: hypothetical protein LUG12_12855 [Erysipelotrichaceae bacterium]|nr:hypothetical protein [Erysipelotrichaceae bacterium]